MICAGDPTLPDLGGGCCYGADVYGPERCTCWVESFDLEQRPVDELAAQLLAGGVAPNTRDQMCPDCAYRPASPEKLGDPEHSGNAGELEDLAAGGVPFWCHQGIRRVTGTRHPYGHELPGHAAAYRPPMRGAVPYRADGSPAELCAGWDARRRALAHDRDRPAAAAAE